MRTTGPAKTVRCLRQRGAVVSDVQKLIQQFQPGFTAWAIFDLKFKDAQTYTDSGLPADTRFKFRNYPQGTVVFTRSMTELRRKERRFIDTNPGIPKSIRPSVTPAIADLDPHGTAFVQWEPKPHRRTNDWRIVLACLGPTNSE